MVLGQTLGQCSKKARANGRLARLEIPEDALDQYTSDLEQDLFDTTNTCKDYSTKALDIRTILNFCLEDLPKDWECWYEFLKEYFPRKGHLKPMDASTTEPSSPRSPLSEFPKPSERVETPSTNMENEQTQNMFAFGNAVPTALQKPSFIVPNVITTKIESLLRDGAKIVRDSGIGPMLDIPERLMRQYAIDLESPITKKCKSYSDYGAATDQLLAILRMAIRDLPDDTYFWEQALGQCASHSSQGVAADENVVPSESNMPSYQKERESSASLQLPSMTNKIEVPGDSATAQAPLGLDSGSLGQIYGFSSSVGPSSSEIATNASLALSIPDSQTTPVPTPNVPLIFHEVGITKSHGDDRVSSGIVGQTSARSLSLNLAGRPKLSSVAANPFEPVVVTASDCNTSSDSFHLGSSSLKEKTLPEDAGNDSGAVRDVGQSTSFKASDRQLVDLEAFIATGRTFEPEGAVENDSAQDGPGASLTQAVKMVVNPEGSDSSKDSTSNNDIDDNNHKSPQDEASELDAKSGALEPEHSDSEHLAASPADDVKMDVACKTPDVTTKNTAPSASQSAGINSKNFVFTSSPESAPRVTLNETTAPKTFSVNSKPTTTGEVAEPSSPLPQTPNPMNALVKSETSAFGTSPMIIGSLLFGTMAHKIGQPVPPNMAASTGPTSKSAALEGGSPKIAPPELAVPNPMPSNTALSMPAAPKPAARIPAIPKVAASKAPSSPDPEFLGALLKKVKSRPEITPWVSSVTGSKVKSPGLPLSRQAKGPSTPTSLGLSEPAVHSTEGSAPSQCVSSATLAKPASAALEEKPHPAPKQTAFLDGASTEDAKLLPRADTAKSSQNDTTQQPLDTAQPTITVDKQPTPKQAVATLDGGENSDDTLAVVAPKLAAPTNSSCTPPTKSEELTTVTDDRFGQILAFLKAQSDARKDTEEILQRLTKLEAHKQDNAEILGRLAKIDAGLVEQKQLIDIYEKSLAKREVAVVAREDAATAYEQQLELMKQKQSELNVSSGFKEQLLAKREVAATVREKSVAVKDERLQSTEQKLEEQKQVGDAKKKSLAEREIAIITHEKAIVMKKMTLTGREIGVAERERLAMARNKQLQLKEQQVEQKQPQLEKKESELERNEQQLAKNATVSMTRQEETMAAHINAFWANTTSKTAPKTSEHAGSTVNNKHEPASNIKPAPSRQAAKTVLQQDLHAKNDPPASLSLPTKIQLEMLEKSLNSKTSRLNLSRLGEGELVLNLPKDSKLDDEASRVKKQMLKVLTSFETATSKPNEHARLLQELLFFKANFESTEYFKTLPPDVYTVLEAWKKGDLDSMLSDRTLWLNSKTVQTQHNHLTKLEHIVNTFNALPNAYETLEALDTLSTTGADASHNNVVSRLQSCKGICDAYVKALDWLHKNLPPRVEVTNGVKCTLHEEFWRLQNMLKKTAKKFAVSIDLNRLSWD
ncbi:Nn.00g047150.m01.CDS01 [Neocucurbitaria sp. VM-36]